MFFTCVFTVLTEMYSMAAISTCDRVPCRYRSTVRSRLVNGSTRVPAMADPAPRCEARCGPDASATSGWIVAVRAATTGGYADIAGATDSISAPTAGPPGGEERPGPSPPAPLHAAPGPGLARFPGPADLPAPPG